MSAPSSTTRPVIAPARAPRLLRAGDKVRVVAPSGPFDRHRLELGLACLQKAGLRPHYDEGIFAARRYLAGDDARRLAELRAALADTDAAAIWFARGGYGATRLLPGLIDAPLAASPKWLVGFSDATALHALWQSRGLASLHGPNVTTLDSWGAEARTALWQTLFDGAPSPLTGRTVLGRGRVRGPVIGGNLTVLAAMAGGRFLPAIDGAILLMEDIGERPYRLDRCLTTLAQAGLLDGVAGFAIGQLTGCDEPRNGQAKAQGSAAPYDALTVVVERLAELAPQVPVIAELPVGHEASSFPLVLGHPAVLDLDAGRLETEAVAPTVSA